MLRATAGSRLFIGPETRVADHGRLGAHEPDWTEIGRMEALGELATEWRTEHLRWARGPELGEHVKMGRQGGGMRIVMGLDDADPGQRALIAAERSPSNFAFLLRFGRERDAPFRIWVGLVASLGETYENGGSVMKRSAEILINSPPRGAGEEGR